MARTGAFVRALAATLAVAAIAAPASLARPTDSPPIQPPEPAPQKMTPFNPESPLYWGFEYEAGRPQDRPATTADDTPWATIGLAITGSVLLLGGVALASRNVVHARRARVAA